MDAAALITIIAVVLIVLALVFYLVSVIGELRKITAGLDVVIGAVGEILTKTEPVEGVVKAINSDLSAGSEMLEGLLAKKAGPEDGPGLVESLFPGGGAALLRRQGREGPVKNIDVVYTRGAVQLARLGRESPLGTGGDPGAALRDPLYSSAAARSLYFNPARPAIGARERPRSPAIGSGAPAVYGVRGDEDRSDLDVDREGGDRADAYDHPPAESTPGPGTKDEPDMKDMGLGARPSDERSAE